MDLLTHIERTMRRVVDVRVSFESRFCRGFRPTTNTGEAHMDFLQDQWRVIVAIVAGLIFLLSYKLILWLCGVIIIPDDSIGVVTKKFVLFGAHRDLPDGRIIALHGEAGYQADTLPPGLHVGLWPWQYTVELVKFFTIPQGKIG